MSKRNTETLFLRVDPEVARMVRRACEQREVTLGQFAEMVFRQHLAETTTGEDRKNLLSNVEGELVARLDRRLGGHLERVAGLYAREAFDHAEALFLIKVLLSLELRDTGMVERYLGNARKDATERLKSRTGPVADFMAQARAAVDQLRAELGDARQATAQERARADMAEKRAADLESKMAALHVRLKEESALHKYERARDEWAAQQYETQGMLRRRSFQEWRAEYVRQHPAPKVG
ncbi:MAG TPA: hypothetical protein VK464_12290 [Symbiobacteriaceae bacterium]|jgi:hypothetical protein|nr:hypothetical protein [Symbiobacteriaceae bacterium]